jgi:long-chain acyl-CoA synthetase
MPGNRTIPRLWRDAVARNTGTGYLVEQDGTWREVPWAEAAERVTNLANGLLARGVGKGEAFGILARNTLEWSLFDFALAHVGAVGAAIYANSAPGDVQYVLAHSESVGVLCEDDTQRAKVEAAGSSLPACGSSSRSPTCRRSKRRAGSTREANPGARRRGRRDRRGGPISRSSTRPARRARRRAA